MMFPRFPVLPFPPLRFGPTFSSPAFSSPAFSASPRFRSLRLRWDARAYAHTHTDGQGGNVLCPAHIANTDLPVAVKYAHSQRQRSISGGSL